jgi:hypothetical protein
MTIYIRPDTYDEIHRRSVTGNIPHGKVIDDLVTTPGRTAAAKRDGAVAVQTLTPPEFYDHPGWRLNSTGANVCTRCGKTKSRSRNASCIAP